MNTGKLSRRITIVSPGAMTPDGIGGFTEGTVTTFDTWCAAKQLSMTEILSFGLETSTSNYQFTFKYYSVDNVTRIKDLIYEGRNFRVSQVREVDEMKSEVQIIASERL
jgi:SPP1 family predicted phage head-tail adaptor